MKKFTTFVYAGLLIFIILSLVSWCALNIVSLNPHRTGWGFTPEWIVSLWVWGSCTAIALFFFAAATQLKALGQNRARLYVPSVAGLVLIAGALLYTLGIFWSPVFGVFTNSYMIDLWSYWAKHALILGVLLLQSAFVYSYRPVRGRALQFVSVGCAVVSATLFMVILYSPGSAIVYFRGVVLFAFLSAVTTLVVWWLGRRLV